MGRGRGDGGYGKTDEKTIEKQDRKEKDKVNRKGRKWDFKGNYDGSKER